MSTDNENKDKQFDSIRELLKKHYTPKDETNPDTFWKELSDKIQSMFHSELYSDNLNDSYGRLLTDEERYFLGIEEYINNEVGALKHKAITDHLLKCKECISNYNKVLSKKKQMIVA